MAIRATSKATLGFGLVSVPVALFKSTDASSVKFVQLHKGCGQRVRQPKECETCGSVEKDDIVKGYETEKGKYLIMEDADFQGLPVGDTDTIEIVEFITTMLDPRIYDGSVHFVAPQKGGLKAFGLLRSAMEAEGKTAIVKLTFKDKQHLAELRVYNDNLLIAAVLRFADELRSTAEYRPELPETNEKELAIARKLVAALTTKKFDITRFKDEYRVALETRINEKLEGKTYTVQAQVEEKKEVDLTEALLASIKAAAK